MNATTGWTTLVDAATLAVALGRDDLVLLDCRSVLTDPDAGAQMYADGHRPGAFHASLERDLSDMAQAGQGRHPWPRADAFARTLAQWFGRAPDVGQPCRRISRQTLASLNLNNRKRSAR